MSDIIDLGNKFFGRFSSEYTSGQIYIARIFFLQSNTRVCRSKLPSGWRPRVIFLLQTLVCEDCSKKFPAIYLSLGILYMRIALKCHMIYIDKLQLPRENFRYNLLREKFFRAILFRIYLGTDIYRQKFFLAVQHSCLSLKITLGLAPSCNFLATNTHVSGLLEKYIWPLVYYTSMYMRIGNHVWLSIAIFYLYWLIEE
jgi:hypothetical protein